MGKSNVEKEEITIEKAGDKDLKKIIELYKQLNTNVNFEKIDKIILDDLWSNIKRNRSINIFILKKNKDIIATCTLVIIYNIAQGGKPNALIESFITDAKHRNKGYGTMLLKYIIELAEDFGCHKIMLMVKLENNKAKSFYEKMGFNSGIRDSLSMIISPL